jgi:hypothetical protein
MSFAVIIELATFIAYAVIILGGKQQRDYGWKIVCGLLGVGAAVQCAGMAIVVSSSALCNYDMVLTKQEGLPLRHRRAILPRLAPRYLLDTVHCELECAHVDCRWDRSSRVCSA